MAWWMHHTCGIKQSWKNLCPWVSNNHRLTHACSSSGTARPSSLMESWDYMWMTACMPETNISTKNLSSSKRNTHLEASASTISFSPALTSNSHQMEPYTSHNQNMSEHLIQSKFPQIDASKPKKKSRKKKEINSVPLLAAYHTPQFTQGPIYRVDSGYPFQSTPIPPRSKETS